MTSQRQGTSQIIQDFHANILPWEQAVRLLAERVGSLDQRYRALQFRQL